MGQQKVHDGRAQPPTKGDLLGRMFVRAGNPSQTGKPKAGCPPNKASHETFPRCFADMTPPELDFASRCVSPRWDLASLDGSRAIRRRHSLAWLDGEGKAEGNQQVEGSDRFETCVCCGCCSPTAESFGVSAQIGSGSGAGFHQGSARVPPGFYQGFTRVPLGFHEVLRGLWGGASTKKSTACCWGGHLSLFFAGGGGGAVGTQNAKSKRKIHRTSKARVPAESGTNGSRDGVYRSPDTRRYCQMHLLP